MDVKVTPHPDKSQVELAITATAQELKPYIDKAARKLSEEQPIKGFRPGKVSVPVAMDSYGKDRVLQEALDLALPKFFVSAVLDHDLQAINRPNVSISQLSAEEGLAFTATVDVLPEVTIGDTSKIKVEPREVAVTDEEVEKELALLAKMRATPLEVARPAKVGDTVTVDFTVSMNGQPMEGGSSKNHPIHLGEGHFIPDFEKKLEGIQAGDNREFTMTFPEDFATQELRGKTAEAQVKAHSVQQRMLPELNDDFAKKVGKFTTIAELRTTLKENMGHEKLHKEDDRVEAELSEKLAEASTFGPIPDILIERDVDQRLQEFSQMLSMQQKTIENYMATHNKKLDDIRAEMRPTAEKAVKIGLALRALAEREKIEASDEEIAAKLEVYLQRYASPDAAEKQEQIDDLKDNITTMIRNQKTLKRLREMAGLPAESHPHSEKTTT